MHEIRCVFLTATKAGVQGKGVLGHALLKAQKVRANAVCLHPQLVYPLDIAPV